MAFMNHHLTLEWSSTPFEAWQLVEERLCQSEPGSVAGREPTAQDM